VTAPASGPLTNRAGVTATTPDPKAANDHIEITTGVATRADLSVTMSAAPNVVSVGQYVTLTITATNGGPSVAAGILLTTTLPAKVAPLSATPPAGCTYSAGKLACSIATLAAGGQASVEYGLRTTDWGALTAAADVSGTVVDPLPGNNHTTADFTSQPYQLYLPIARRQ
jgi:uncharacterized repeat protein (TIGR01451 family)